MSDKKKDNQRAILANPRGFCAGVDRAIEIVERAIKKFGAPIYVRHEIVHNRFVVDSLKKMGAVFVEELADIPDDSIVILSAHGVSKKVQDEANIRQLKVFDATCPLVTKVHHEVIKYAQAGIDVVLIGHDGHPEVIGTKRQYVGYAEGGGQIYVVESVDDVKKLKVNNPLNLSYATQTTISMDDSLSIVVALKDMFPEITGPRKADICYATQNRQDAVKKLACIADVIFVVGSSNSSNSNRLKEIALDAGINAYLIDSADELDFSMIKDSGNIGVTAGASAPQILVDQVVEKLSSWGVVTEEMAGDKEGVVFLLPLELR